MELLTDTGALAAESAGELLREAKKGRLVAVLARGDDGAEPLKTSEEPFLDGLKRGRSLEDRRLPVGRDTVDAMPFGVVGTLKLAADVLAETNEMGVALPESEFSGVEGLEDKDC